MESAFRFSLYKSRKPSDKLTCPGCERPRTWVRYVDTLSGEFLPEQYGRCDRQTNCGHYLNPYKDGYHKTTYHHERNANTAWKPTKQPHREPEKKPKQNIPLALLEASLPGYENNQFVKFLQTLFPDEVVSRLIATYLIGTSDRWPGATVFWFVNSRGEIRGGQIKHFDATGHTWKDRRPDGSVKSRTTWIHSTEGYKYNKAGKTLPDWLKAYNEQESRVDCLYAEWLLEADSMKPVALFESPKSAIIAAPYFPDYICLATGSLSYFTRKRIQVLRGRNVVVYPDLSKDGTAFKDWKQKGETFTEVNFRVSTMLEEDPTITAKQRSDGYDMADYIVDRLNCSMFADNPTQAEHLLPDEKAAKLQPGTHIFTNHLGRVYPVTINEDRYPADWDL